MATTTRAPAMFVSHGGGPMPILNPDSEVTVFLKNKARKWLLNGPSKPKGVILVTAHWESPQPIFSTPSDPTSKGPGLLFDYYNFPPASYQLKYDAPSVPRETVDRIQSSLGSAGIPSGKDMKRGWDHGVFIPLLCILPEAELPILQASVPSSQDATELLKYGLALSKFRNAEGENLAVVGSGMSFHNMRSLMSGGSQPALQANKDFEEELSKTLKLKDDQERWKALVNWRSWKGAKECQPNGATEHFSPLLVVAGASFPSDFKPDPTVCSVGTGGIKDSHLVDVFNFKTSNFLFE